MSAESVKKHTGVTHLFTNRSQSDTITLKAGPGETLLIEGQVGDMGWPLQNTLDIFTYSRGPSTTDLTNRQGYKTQIDPVGGLSAFVAAGTASTVPAVTFTLVEYDTETETFSTGLNLTQANSGSNACGSSLFTSGSIYGDTVCFGGYEPMQVHYDIDEPVFVNKVYEKQSGTWTLAQTVTDVQSFDSILCSENSSWAKYILYHGVSGIENAQVFSRASAGASFSSVGSLSYAVSSSSTCVAEGEALVSTIDSSGDHRIYNLSTATEDYYTAGSWSHTSICNDATSVKVLLGSTNLVQFMTYDTTLHTLTSIYDIPLSGTIRDLKLSLLPSTGDVVMAVVVGETGYIYELQETEYFQRSAPFSPVRRIDLAGYLFSTMSPYNSGVRAVVSAFNAAYSSVTNTVSSSEYYLGLESTSGTVKVLCTKGALSSTDASFVVDGAGIVDLMSDAITCTGLSVAQGTFDDITCSNLTVSSMTGTSISVSGGSFSVITTGTLNVTTTANVGSVIATNSYAQYRYGSCFGRYVNTTETLTVPNDTTTIVNSYWIGSVVNNNGGQATTGPVSVALGDEGIFIIVTAGIYIMTGSVTFASNAGGYRELYIRRVGSDLRDGHCKLQAMNGDTTVLNVTAIVSASAGHQYRCYVRQTSGGDLNLLPASTTGYNNVFTITKIADFA